MKFSLASCILVLYLLTEVSAKPAPQFLDQAREMLDRAKEKAQEAIDQFQESLSHAIETARNAMQTGFNSAQQTAQSKIGLGEHSARNSEPSVTQNTSAA